MKRLIVSIIALLVMVGQLRAARADVLQAPVTQVAGSTAVIDDTAGPSDYGSTIIPASTSLDELTVGDNRQGQIPNCWEKVVEDAIIRTNRAALQRNYQVLADGTVNVTFFRSGLPITYHITPNFNPWYGDPNTGYDGAHGDAAGQLLQKAFAAFRTSGNTMSGLGWGLPSEAMQAYGLTAGNMPATVAAIANVLAEGGIAAVDTGWQGEPDLGVPANHSVYAVSVDLAAGTVTFGNPWGDGYSGFPEYTTWNQDDLTKYAVLSQYGFFGGFTPPASRLSVPEPRYVFPVAAVAAAAVLGRRKRAA